MFSLSICNTAPDFSSKKGQRKNKSVVKSAQGHDVTLTCTDLNSASVKISRNKSSQQNLQRLSLRTDMVITENR
jgi:hypothetical protein